MDGAFPLLRILSSGFHGALKCSLKVILELMPLNFKIVSHHSTLAAVGHTKKFTVGVMTAKNFNLKNKKSDTVNILINCNVLVL